MQKAVTRFKMPIPAIRSLGSQSLTMLIHNIRHATVKVSRRSQAALFSDTGHYCEACCVKQTQLTAAIASSPPVASSVKSPTRKGSLPLEILVLNIQTHLKLPRQRVKRAYDRDLRVGGFCGEASASSMAGSSCRSRRSASGGGAEPVTPDRLIVWLSSRLSVKRRNNPMASLFPLPLPLTANGAGEGVGNSRP